MSTTQEGKFEVIASMRAGCARNQTQSANTILVTPIAEPGILELYNAKKTIHYRNFEYKDQSIQISQYELRWKSISKESELQNINIPITDEHEFVRYSEVQDGVVYVLRNKKAWKDHLPYFFWSQESDSSMNTRFLSSFNLCLEMMENDKHDIEAMNNAKILDLNEFIKERKMDKIFDDESICKQFYPFVDESLRSPEGLKRIVHSLSFKKNVSQFQMALDSLGCDSAFTIYGMPVNELPPEENIEMGCKSYVKRVETWAKNELEKEKKDTN